MRSVGLGLAFLATTLMVAGPALAQGSEGKDAKDPKAATAETKAAETKAATAKDADAKGAKPAETKPAPGTVTLHIEVTGAKVSLEKRSGGEAWAHVCDSPCDASVSVTDEYRIVGDDMNPSKPFLLDGTAGEKVTLDVTPGRENKYKTGAWVLGAGAVGIVGGIVVVAVGSGTSDHTAGGANSSTTYNKNTNFISGGVALIVAGAVASVFGGAMMIDNAHTKVEGPVATPAEKTDDKTKGFSVQVTASRAPTWHEERGPSAAKATFFPVLAGSF